MFDQHLHMIQQANKRSNPNTMLCRSLGRFHSQFKNQVVAHPGLLQRNFFSGTIMENKACIREKLTAGKTLFGSAQIQWCINTIWSRD